MLRSQDCFYATDCLVNSPKTMTTAHLKCALVFQGHLLLPVLRL